MAIDGNILLGVAFDSASYSSAQKQLQNLSRSATVDIKVNNAPLGRINADLHEFDKSLQAANARVLAFGASTGAVYGIATAFTEVGKAFINVEAKFKSIQVVLKSTTDVFDNFKGSIFAIGRDTGKSFEEVTDAAQELVRQGLKISETLQRTSDAMILSRQSGLSASEAVTSLTAALNTFNQEALTSTDVINKLANVDSSFAVSQKDLIDAISRSGSAAQDAGVQFDKLLAFTTSLQQTTARGGAVIGNALKSIFTRVQRSTTLEALEEFNIQTKDLQGNVLSADVLLQNLANTYKTLSTAERSAISEQVAGIQQINQLKALLGDLARANSVYGQALKTSSGSVNEAIDRNKSLNETLKATLNSTKLNALEFSETVGKLALAPALKFPIGTANALFDIFKDKDQDSKSTGQKLGEGILRGIGSVLSGPGLVLATAIVTNTLKELGRFTLSIVSDYSSLNNKTKEQVNVQQAISQILSDGNNKYASRLLAARNIKEEESAIRSIMLEQNNIIARKNAMYAQPVRNIVNQGGDVLREGAFKLPKRAAGGYLPVQEEQNDIQRGVGGASSAARPKVIPNFNFGGGKRGTIVANTDEYIVPNYGGGEGSAIFNPKMVAQHGLPNGAQKINAAGGFVPNFARYYHGTSKDQLFENKNREDLNFRKTQRGVFITTNPAYASAYSMDNDSMNTMSAITGRKNRNSRVIPIELDVKNPYIMSNDEIYDYDRAKSYIKFQREIANKARRLGHDAVDYGHGTISYIGDPKNLKPFYTAKNASTGFVPNFAELPDKSIYRHYYKQYKKFLKKGSFESDLGGYGHWDGMGRYNKSTVMYRGTGGNEIGELLEKGQFQSQWQDSIEKTPATFISADLSQAAHYAKRTGRDPFGFFEDDDLKNKGSQFIYGLRKNIVKGNYGPDVVKTMQGDTATNVALRNPIKSKEDLRLLMAYDPAAKNVKSALKPVPYGYLKEVLGGAAGGLIPNFVRKSKYKFPKISSATMEANISKNLSNLPPEDIKYFSRAYEDYSNISGVFAKATNFSKEDFVDVMSALSPANPLERNALDALRYTLFAKSKLSTGVSRQSLNPDEISSIPAPTYGANRRKAAKIITGSEQLTGNKRNSFSSNIINPFASKDVTVDFRAQSSALGRKFDVKNAPSMNREQYDKVSQAFRNVGSNFGISGLGIQAADWIGQRMNTKVAKGQDLNRGIIKFLYENPDKITLENLDFLLSAPAKAAARKEYLKKVSSMGISKLGSDSLISIPRMGDGFVPNFADKLLRSEAIAKIMAAKNQIFGAEFTKRTTGESRTGTFRLARNVKAGKVGGSLPYKAKDHQLVPVFDMGLSKKKGAGDAYRMLPYEGLNKLHIDGKEYDVVDNMAGGFVPNFAVDNKKLDEFARNTKERLKLRDFDLNQDSRSGGGIKLSLLSVPRELRKQGLGTQAMNDLASFADENKERLLLSTADKNKSFGTTSRARLIKFYKRFGFVQNKGRNKDYRISESMYRNPQDNMAGGFIPNMAKIKHIPLNERREIFAKLRQEMGGVKSLALGGGKEMFSDKELSFVPRAIRTDEGDFLLSYRAATDKKRLKYPDSHVANRDKVDRSGGLASLLLGRSHEDIDMFNTIGTTTSQSVLKQFRATGSTYVDRPFTGVYATPIDKIKERFEKGKIGFPVGSSRYKSKYDNFGPREWEREISQINGGNLIATREYGPSGRIASGGFIPNYGKLGTDKLRIENITSGDFSKSELKKIKSLEKGLNSKSFRKEFAFSGPGLERISLGIFDSFDSEGLKKSDKAAAQFDYYTNTIGLSRETLKRYGVRGLSKIIGHEIAHGFNLDKSFTNRKGQIAGTVETFNKTPKLNKSQSSKLLKEINSSYIISNRQKEIGANLYEKLIGNEIYKNSRAAGGFIPNYADNLLTNINNPNFLEKSIAKLFGFNLVTAESDEDLKSKNLSGRIIDTTGDFYRYQDKDTGLLNAALLKKKSTSALVTTPKFLNLDKFSETQISKSLPESRLASDLFKKYNITPSNDRDTYGNQLNELSRKEFGGDTSVFFKGTQGLQGKQVFTTDTIYDKTLEVPSPENLFIQKAIKPEKGSSEMDYLNQFLKEYRVDIVGGRSGVFGGIPLIKQRIKPKAERDKDKKADVIEGNLHINKSNFGFLRHPIDAFKAVVQARKAIKSLDPKLRAGAVFGADTFPAGVIEFNPLTKSGTSGSSNQNFLSSLITGIGIRRASKENVNYFTGQGKDILNLSGSDQTKKFKVLYKELLELQKSDSYAYLKVAKNLNELGFGLTIGRGKQKEAFGGDRASNFFKELGLAGGYVPNFAKLSFTRLGRGSYADAHIIGGDDKLNKYLVKSPLGSINNAFEETKDALILARRLSRRQRKHKNFDILNPVSLDAGFISEEHRKQIKEKFGDQAYLQRLAPGKVSSLNGYENDVEDYLNDKLVKKKSKGMFGDFHGGNYSIDKKGRSSVFDLYYNNDKLGSDSAFTPSGSSVHTGSQSRGFIPNFVNPKNRYTLGYGKFKPNFLGLKNIFSNPLETISNLPFRIAGSLGAYGVGAALKAKGSAKDKLIAEQFTSAGRYLAGIGGARTINLDESNVHYALGKGGAEALTNKFDEKHRREEVYDANGLFNTIGSYKVGRNKKGNIIQDGFDFDNSQFSQEQMSAYQFSQEQIAYGGFSGQNDNVKGFTETIRVPRAFTNIAKKISKLLLPPSPEFSFNRERSRKIGPITIRTNEDDDNLSVSASGKDLDFARYGSPFLTRVKYSEGGSSNTRNYAGGFIPNFATRTVYHGTSDPSFAEKLKLTGLKGLAKTLKTRDSTGTSFTDKSDLYDTNSRGLFVTEDLPVAKKYAGDKGFIFKTNIDDSNFLDLSKQSKVGLGANDFYGIGNKKQYNKLIKGKTGVTYNDREKAEGSGRFLEKFPGQEITKNYVISRGLKDLDFVKAAGGFIPNYVNPFKDQILYRGDLSKNRPVAPDSFFTPHQATAQRYLDDAGAPGGFLGRGNIDQTLLAANAQKTKDFLDILPMKYKRLKAASLLGYNVEHKDALTFEIPSDHRIYKGKKYDDFKSGKYDKIINDAPNSALSALGGRSSIMDIENDLIGGGKSRKDAEDMVERYQQNRNTFFDPAKQLRKVKVNISNPKIFKKGEILELNPDLIAQIKKDGHDSVIRYGAVGGSFSNTDKQPEVVVFNPKNIEDLTNASGGYIPNFVKPYLAGRIAKIKKENSFPVESSYEYLANRESYERKRPRITNFLRELTEKHGKIIGLGGEISTEFSENENPLIFSGQKNAKARPKFATLDKRLAASYSIGAINSKLSSEKSLDSRVSKNTRLGYLHSQEANIDQEFYGNFGIEDANRSNFIGKYKEPKTLRGLGNLSESVVFDAVKGGSGQEFYETLFDNLKKSKGSIVTRFGENADYLHEIDISKLTKEEARKLKRIVKGQNSLQSFAGGYIPNFNNPLKNAISREQAAGLPLSQIRVENHPSLISDLNPGGLAVTNKRDEPGGITQGISRARKEGRNPKTYGSLNSANGLIPNFAPQTYFPPTPQFKEQDVKYIGLTGNTSRGGQTKIDDFTKNIKLSDEDLLLPTRDLKDKIRAGITEAFKIDPRFVGKSFEKGAEKIADNFVQTQQGAMIKAYQKNLKSGQDSYTKQELVGGVTDKISQNTGIFGWFKNAKIIRDIKSTSEYKGLGAEGQLATDKDLTNLNLGASEKRQAKLQSRALAVSFGLPVLTGALTSQMNPNDPKARRASGIAEGVSTGLSVASIGGFTAPAIAAGIVVGGISAISGTRKSKRKSQEQLSEQLTNVRGRFEDSRNAVLGTFQSQDTLKEAIEKGASLSQVRQLSRQVTNSLSGIQDSSLRKKVVAATNDEERASALAEADQAGIKQVSRAGLESKLEEVIAPTRGILSDATGRTKNVVLKPQEIKDIASLVSGATSLKFDKEGKVDQKQLTGLQELNKKGDFDIGDIEKITGSLKISREARNQLNQLTAEGQKDIAKEVVERQLSYAALSKNNEGLIKYNNLLLRVGRTLDTLSSNLDSKFKMQNINTAGIRDRAISGASQSLAGIGEFLSPEARLKQESSISEKQIENQRISTINEAATGWVKSLRDLENAVPEAMKGNEGGEKGGEGYSAKGEPLKKEFREILTKVIANGKSDPVSAGLEGLKELKNLNAKFDKSTDPNGRLKDAVSKFTQNLTQGVSGADTTAANSKAALDQTTKINELIISLQRSQNFLGGGTFESSKDLDFSKIQSSSELRKQFKNDSTNPFKDRIYKSRGNSFDDFFQGKKIDEKAETERRASNFGTLASGSLQLSQLGLLDKKGTQKARYEVAAAEKAQLENQLNNLQEIGENTGDFDLLDNIKKARNSGMVDESSAARALKQIPLRADEGAKDAKGDTNPLSILAGLSGPLGALSANIINLNSKFEKGVQGNFKELSEQAEEATRKLHNFAEAIVLLQNVQKNEKEGKDQLDKKDQIKKAQTNLSNAQIGVGSVEEKIKKDIDNKNITGGTDSQFTAKTNTDRLSFAHPFGGATSIADPIGSNALQNINLDEGSQPYTSQFLNFLGDNKSPKPLTSDSTTSHYKGPSGLFEALLTLNKVPFKKKDVNDFVGQTKALNDPKSGMTTQKLMESMREKFGSEYAPKVIDSLVGSNLNNYESGRPNLTEGSSGFNSMGNTLKERLDAINRVLEKYEKELKEKKEIEKKRQGELDDVSKSRGLIPNYSGGLSKSFRQEQKDIAKGIGGARPGDSPYITHLAGVGPAVVNTGEKIIRNFAGGGKDAVLNRKMMNFADGLSPDDSYQDFHKDASKFSNKLMAGKGKIEIGSFAVKKIIDQLAEKVTESTGSSFAGKATKEVGKVGDELGKILLESKGDGPKKIVSKLVTKVATKYGTEGMSKFAESKGGQFAGHIVNEAVPVGVEMLGGATFGAAALPAALTATLLPIASVFSEIAKGSTHEELVENLFMNKQEKKQSQTFRYNRDKEASDARKEARIRKEYMAKPTHYQLERETKKRLEEVAEFQELSDARMAYDFGGQLPERLPPSEAEIINQIRGEELDAENRKRDRESGFNRFTNNDFSRGLIPNYAKGNIPNYAKGNISKKEKPNISKKEKPNLSSLLTTLGLDAKESAFIQGSLNTFDLRYYASALSGKEGKENMNWVSDSIRGMIEKRSNKSDNLSGGYIPNYAEGLKNKVKFRPDLDETYDQSFNPAVFDNENNKNGKTLYNSVTSAQFFADLELRAAQREGNSKELVTANSNEYRFRTSPDYNNEEIAQSTRDALEVKKEALKSPYRYNRTKSSGSNYAIRELDKAEEYLRTKPGYEQGSRNIEEYRRNELIGNLIPAAEDAQREALDDFNNNVFRSRPTPTRPRGESPPIDLLKLTRDDLGDRREPGVYENEKKIDTSDNRAPGVYKEDGTKFVSSSPRPATNSVQKESPLVRRMNEIDAAGKVRLAKYGIKPAPPIDSREQGILEADKKGILRKVPSDTRASGVYNEDGTKFVSSSPRPATNSVQKTSPLSGPSPISAPTISIPKPQPTLESIQEGKYPNMGMNTGGGLFPISPSEYHRQQVVEAQIQNKINTPRKQEKFRQFAEDNPDLFSSPIEARYNPELSRKNNPELARGLKKFAGITEKTGTREEFMERADPGSTQRFKDKFKKPGDPGYVSLKDEMDDDMETRGSPFKPTGGLKSGGLKSGTLKNQDKRYGGTHSGSGLSPEAQKRNDRKNRAADSARGDANTGIDKGNPLGGEEGGKDKGLIAALEKNTAAVESLKTKLDTQPGGPAKPGETTKPGEPAKPAEVTLKSDINVNISLSGEISSQDTRVQEIINSEIANFKQNIEARITALERKVDGKPPMPPVAPTASTPE